MKIASLVSLLGLAPLEGEGGYFVRTHTAPGDNPPWSSIFYLLTAEEKGFSSWHVLTVDEQWHFYAGDPVELYTIDTVARRFGCCRFGNRLEAGEMPQVTVPAGIVQGARLVPGGEWALLGMTVIPAFSDGCWRPADSAPLKKMFPEHSDMIDRLTGGGS